MMFELLFSVALFIFFGYCLFYVSTNVAVSTVSDPLGAALWPQILIVLLLIVLALNMYHLVRKMPKEERSLSAAFAKVNWGKAITSPLFLGMVTLLIYAYLLNLTGFLLTSWILCMVYCYLLGERRLVVIPVFSLVTVVVLFLLFYKGMGIQLPRGTVPFLRNFALSVESLLRSIGK